MQRPVSFSRLLDHLAGRIDPTVERLLQDHAIDAATVDAAHALLTAGRRAVAVLAPSANARRRARQIFREHHTEGPSRPRTRGVLQLVLDTLLGPLPSVRSQTEAPPRFLRFTGAWTLELQLVVDGARVTIRGQVTPPARATTVTATAGNVSKTARIESDGTFVLRGLPVQPTHLDFGSAGNVDFAP